MFPIPRITPVPYCASSPLGDSPIVAASCGNNPIPSSRPASPMTIPGDDALTLQHSPRRSGHFIPFTLFLTLLLIMLLSVSCGTTDVFEKNVNIPGHEWSSSFQPEIGFEIRDTTAFYNIYVVVRHTNAYRYNNLWVNLYVQLPDTTFRNRLDLRLATDDKGWLGSGMDDIYEHRILVNRNGPQQFIRPGRYVFRLEQIMREDPLQHVLNAGIRVEKLIN